MGLWPLPRARCSLGADPGALPRALGNVAALRDLLVAYNRARARGLYRSLEGEVSARVLSGTAAIPGRCAAFLVPAALR